MSVWEYKVISSGKGGFATPALLEKFLGDLGRDEWEIIHYQTLPENPLAFSGLARRPTQRDWTLEDAAAAAAKAEAEKLRAEFEAKFRSATAGGGAGEEPPASFLEEKVAPDDGFRKPVDTSHDADADADDEEPKDEWDKLTAAEEDELPTFFEAIRPHMRRNQRGPGMSVGVDYLAKKWEQSEEDLKGALVECGFVIPEDEDAKAEYLEYDGDLYWLNQNRRGELWINTKEKPRPVFRPVRAEKVIIDEPAKPEVENRRAEERAQRSEESAPASERPQAQQTQGAGEPAAREPKPEAASGGALPEGVALLERIRPMMRRNRRGPGGSGSASFLSRALKVKEEELKAAFVALGLTMPASPSDKPVYTELTNQLWWLNLDSRGGLWINGREKRRDEQPGGEASAEDGGQPEGGAPASESESTAGSSAETPATTSVSPELPSGAGNILAVVRGELKPSKGGSVAAKVEGLAEASGHALDALVASLVATGLKLPEKAREKPVHVEHAGENFWMSRNAKGELWLNAKPAKGAAEVEESEAAEGGEGDAKKSRRSRGRKKEEPETGSGQS
jgi:hypothetical protein